MVIIGRRFENQNLQILAKLFSCFVQVFKGCPVEGCHKTNIKSGHSHAVLEGLLPQCLVNYSEGLNNTIIKIGLYCFIFFKKKMTKL